MFKILYDARVRDDIARFPASARERIRTTIENKLYVSPEIFGKPLRHSLKGFRSLRVGEYRVVYLIRSNEVLVLLIAHRKEVYKQMEGRVR